jgi:hypothetical protein
VGLCLQQAICFLQPRFLFLLGGFPSGEWVVVGHPRSCVAPHIFQGVGHNLPLSHSEVHVVVTAGRETWRWPPSFVSILSSSWVGGPPGIPLPPCQALAEDEKGASDLALGYYAEAADWYLKCIKLSPEPKLAADAGRRAADVRPTRTPVCVCMCVHVCACVCMCVRVCACVRGASRPLHVPGLMID